MQLSANTAATVPGNSGLCVGWCGKGGVCIAAAILLITSASSSPGCGS